MSWNYGAIKQYISLSLDTIEANRSLKAAQNAGNGSKADYFYVVLVKGQPRKKQAKSITSTGRRH